VKLRFAFLLLLRHFSLKRDRRGLDRRWNRLLRRGGPSDACKPGSISDLWPCRRKALTTCAVEIGNLEQWVSLPFAFFLIGIPARIAAGFSTRLRDQAVEVLLVPVMTYYR
jgi:hypothetical protein